MATMTSAAADLTSDTCLGLTSEALSLMHAQGAQAPRPDALTNKVLGLWRAHVNEGFLGYRKSMGDGDAGAKLDWADAGGAWVTDAWGVRFLDCLSGFGVFNAGHSHPVIVGAVRAQLAKQPLHSQEFLDPLRAYLAGALARVTPGGGVLSHAFFVNSGAEAVEAALKLSIMRTGRSRVLACLNGFHGKTLGALAATSKALFRAPFVGALVDTVHVPFNDVEALHSAFAAAEFVGKPFAALIIEPVQGEGGIHVGTAEFLRAARAACTAAGTCLVLDEVQSGMGRCGRLCAVDALAPGVVPDALCLGKSLGGGVMPVAAVCGTTSMWEGYVKAPFLLTTTFGGNPLACAAALAALHVTLSEDLPLAAATRGAQLKAGLHSLVQELPDVFREVRGVGLMLGVECRSNAAGVAWSRALLGRRVIVSGTLISATTIRVCPPLVITAEEVDDFLAIARAAALDVRASQSTPPRARL